MPNTLSSRLSLMLMGMFLVIGALLVGISQRMPQLQQLVELGAELVAAAIAFALLAALLVFNLLTRRLRVLAEEMESFRASNFSLPRRIAWSCPDGDEIDRLACSFSDLSDHIARQIAQLEGLDAQRRELLANVSHDLRTPLTLMQGYLETMLLRRGEMTAAEERACLEVAARHAERLGRLVADLFELTKLDGQSGQVQGEAFSVAELVQDVAQKFQQPASARGVGVRLAIDAGVSAVVGDIGLIERALENLVENALRHTPAGGQVTLQVEASAPRVRVCVRDTGCGIARAHLAQVFDRYFQAPRVELPQGACAPTHGLAEGRQHHAGLGLAITQRIVALHGGQIQVDSTVGVGTVFSFELPAAGHPAQEAA